MRFVPKIKRFEMLVLLIVTASIQLFGQAVPAPVHVFFRVQTAASISAPVSGRLLVFIKQGSGDKEVSGSEFRPEDTWVAAREVHDLAPGTAIEFDADELAYPKAFSALPAGNYEAQAVLDVGHSYSYKERVPEDWISNVVQLPAWTPGTGADPVLTLDHHPEENPRRAAAMTEARAQAKPGVAQLEEFESPMLSRFWGHKTIIRAWVILPPGYDENKSLRYPTAYWTHGFGGDIDGALGSGLHLRARMVDGKMPPMIWVMLDESVPQGTHEFADSVNNGPWGAALTTEFIPALEKKYRMDARPRGRLLNGHSSGGWATLQLQVNYPKVFGGTWSTSPDPSDFHDFTGPDLYAPNANMFHRPDGTPVPIFRDKGKVIATFEQFTHLEDVLGPYGGQVSSFDWVFSPKSDSGAPAQMFDHQSGEVHPDVVAYWHDHYDLAHIVEAHWAERGPSLKGRIHLFVGTADTFYLDGAAHKFEAVLNRLGADPHFTYIPDRTHFDLYAVDQDGSGLFDQIGAEMYAVARPGVAWKKK
jgi:enterochelin esterase-like enzyme